MSKPKKMIVYNQVAGLYFKMQDMGLITDNESLFSTLNLVRSEMIYKALIKMISEVYPSADSNYYEGLLNVDGYNLKDTNIYDDDVFYPLYKNAQDLLQDAKYLQEKLDSNTLYEVLISDNDVFVRGILVIRTLFLKYVNMAVCDRYTLKLAGSQERISFDHTNKLQIDKVILDLIKLQHMKAGDYLEVHQLQLEEFINVSISTEILIKSYNERCVNWPLELTDVIENNVSNVAFQRSNRTRKVMFIYNDTLEPVFPIDFNPEALKLVQDSQNPVIASPAVSNDVSFQVSPLYFYLPFCMILLWLLILLKKLF